MLRGTKTKTRHLDTDQDDAPIPTDNDLEKVIDSDNKLSPKNDTLGAVEKEKSTDSNTDIEQDDHDDDDYVEMELNESESSELEVKEGATESLMKSKNEKGVSKTEPPASVESKGSNQITAKVYNDDDDDLLLESKESESTNEEVQMVNEKDMIATKSDDEPVYGESNKNTAKADDDDGIVSESKERESTDDEAKEKTGGSMTTLDGEKGNSGDLSTKPNLSYDATENTIVKNEAIDTDEEDFAKTGSEGSYDVHVNDGKSEEFKKDIMTANDDDVALDLRKSGLTKDGMNTTTDKKNEEVTKSSNGSEDEPDVSLKELDGIEQFDEVAAKKNAIESNDEDIELKGNKTATKEEDNGETQEDAMQSTGSKEIKSATATDEVKTGGASDGNSDNDRDICKDDPTFLFKGLEGYDCDYIKVNKPEKCLKSYNGFPVATWCPEACGVVEDCLEFKASEGNELETSLKKENNQGSVSSSSIVSTVVESSQTKVDSEDDQVPLTGKASKDEANVTSTEIDSEDDQMPLKYSGHAVYSNSSKGNTTSTTSTTPFTTTGTTTKATTTTSKPGTSVEKSNSEEAEKGSSKAIDEEHASGALAEAETEEVVLGETKPNSSVPTAIIKEVASTEGDISANLTHLDTTQYENSKDVVDMSTVNEPNSTDEAALNLIDYKEVGLVEEAEGGTANSKSNSTTLHVDTNDTVGEDIVESVEEDENQSSGPITNGTKHQDEVESTLNTTHLEIDTSRNFDGTPLIKINCRDDPTFMFKDIEGYDCDYIKRNKPQKCMKEHNGQKVGLASCPQSCNMVEECLKEFGNEETDSPAAQNVTSNVAEDDSSSLIAKGDQKDTFIEETNATTIAIANFTGTEDMDTEYNTTGTIPEEESLASADVDEALSNEGNDYLTFSMSHDTIFNIFNSINDIRHNVDSIHR